MILSGLQDTMRSIANVDDNRLPNTEATLFLNAAVQTIMEVTKLRFGEAYISTAFVADTPTINPAPSNGGLITQPTKMWFADSTGSKSEVFETSWDEYVNKWGTAAQDGVNGSGDPKEFAIYGEDDNGNPTFYLGPIPSSNRSPVYLTARITFAPLSLPTDHNQLTDRAPLAVIYKALELAASFLENEERITTWQAHYAMFIKNLIVSHSGARYSAKSQRSMQEPG